MGWHWLEEVVDAAPAKDPPGWHTECPCGFQGSLSALLAHRAEAHPTAPAPGVLRTYEMVEAEPAPYRIVPANYGDHRLAPYCHCGLIQARVCPKHGEIVR